MVSSGEVQQDGQTLEQKLEKYEKEITGLKGSWKGDSYDNLSSKASEFVGEYTGVISEQVSSFAEAVDLYEEYVKLKKKKKELESRLSSMDDDDPNRATIIQEIDKIAKEMKALKAQIEGILASITESLEASGQSYAVSVPKGTDGTGEGISYADLASFLGGSSGVSINSLVDSINNAIGTSGNSITANDLVEGINNAIDTSDGNITASDIVAGINSAIGATGNTITTSNLIEGINNAIGSEGNSLTLNDVVTNINDNVSNNEILLETINNSMSIPTSSNLSQDSVNWALNVANDDSHGYSQSSRWGNSDYDCSSFVISAWDEAGVPVKDAGANYTGNMREAFLSTGQFEWIQGSPDVNSLSPGDVLLNESGHTEMYIGNGQLVGAHSNYDGYAGDSNGNEISTTNYYDFPWDGVLHYIG